MKKFKKFYIEITNVCNLSCDFCPQTLRLPDFMSIDVFKSILDQIKDYTDYLYFHVKGEPLLHPKLNELLDISHEKGFQVNITTNGTLIKRWRESFLHKPALRQINFSLHSLDGNEGISDKAVYMEEILSFVREAIDKTGMMIALRLWNLEENRTADPKRMKNDELLTILEREFKLPYKIMEKVTPGSGVKLADRIYLNQEYRFQWPDLQETEEDGSGFCYGLRNQAAILVDGTVVPCCLDGEGVISLGNIKEAMFSDIIGSDRANHMVEGFSRREAIEPLCRKCGYRKRFG